MNKKAFFFTTIAIALSIVIIISYNVYTGYSLKERMGAVETRVDTMNNFIKDLKNDIGNAIFIVGFRSILSIEDYMVENDDFINNLGISFNDAFEEAFEQGTINGEEMGLTKTNNFLNWTNNMEAEADKIDIILDFTVNSVTISQSEPWMVDISVNLGIDVQDKKNTASWTINKVFTEKINISSFVDPLYLVNNDGLVNNTMRKTNLDPTSSTSNLETHMLNSYYIEHTDAPSYLMRFENNLGSSPYGIESLVNADKLQDAGIVPQTKSMVDYIYFGAANPSSCKIQGLESYAFFRLDTVDPPDHLGFYGAQCVGAG